MLKEEPVFIICRASWVKGHQRLRRSVGQSCKAAMEVGEVVWGMELLSRVLRFVTPNLSKPNQNKQQMSVG
jgi:hypothetical protein